MQVVEVGPAIRQALGEDDTGQGASRTGGPCCSRCSLAPRVALAACLGRLVVIAADQQPRRREPLTQRRRDVPQVAAIEGHGHRVPVRLVQAGAGRVALADQHQGHGQGGGIGLQSDQVEQAGLAGSHLVAPTLAWGRPVELAADHLARVLVHQVGRQKALKAPQLAGSVPHGHQRRAVAQVAQAQPLHALALQVGHALGCGCLAGLLPQLGAAPGRFLVFGQQRRRFLGFQALALGTLRRDLVRARRRPAGPLRLPVPLGTREPEAVLLGDVKQGGHLDRAALAGAAPGRGVFRIARVLAPACPRLPGIAAARAQPIEDREGDPDPFIVSDVGRDEGQGLFNQVGRDFVVMAQGHGRPPHSDRAPGASRPGTPAADREKVFSFIGDFLEGFAGPARGG